MGVTSKLENYIYALELPLPWMKTWYTNIDCSWGEWWKIIVSEVKFNLSLLFTEAQMGCIITDIDKPMCIQTAVINN